MINHLFTFLVLCLLLSGCRTISFYNQAIWGQAAILLKKRPIESLLQDNRTPDEIKSRLSLALDIRKFAERELNLPVGNNYLSYVALDKPYVVWNVYAAREFSLKPRTWCFPIAGCTAYRGYFEEEDALEYAEDLKKEGLDVYVAGITAYSTLGWFNDPLLSTFINISEPGLAGLIFHELAHKVLYVPGDTAFNESFATAVEQAGLKRWLDSRGKGADFDSYLRREQTHKKFVALVKEAREELRTLYQREMPQEEKRKQKEIIIKKLKGDYEEQKKGWQGTKGYDYWFALPVNNAQIITIALYHDLVPAFLSLLEEAGGDMAEFYRLSIALSEKPEQERHRLLKGHF